MKLFSQNHSRHWLLLVAFWFFSLPLFAQDGDRSQTVPEPAAAATRAEPANEPAEPTSPAVERDGDSAASDQSGTAIDRGPGIRFRGGRGGEYVGIFSDVEVGENETADVVVAVRSDYVIKGRSRSEAVAILGDGDVEGPVDGNCVTVFGGVKVRAPVNGGLVVVGSRAFIDAPVKGDVVLVMSEVEFGPNARISGETIMVGPQAKVHPDATFDGRIKKVNLGERFPALLWLGDYLRQGPIYGRPIAPSVAACWYVVGFFFLFRLIVVLLFPKPIETGANILRERALRSFLVGLIAYILFFPALLILVATGVGAIAVPFLVVALVIAAMLGKISLLRSVGGQLGRQLNMPGLDTTMGGFIAGTTLITVIYLVPVLGGIVFLLIKPMALGAVLIAAAESFSRERPAPPTVPPTLNRTTVPQPAAAMTTTMPASVPPEKPTSETSSAPAGQVPPVIGQNRVRPGDVPPEELLAMPRVGFWPRLGATFLDFMLVMVTVGWWLRLENVFPLVWLAYHVAMWTWRGTTLGGIVFSLRIIRLDGRAPDFTVVLVRALASCLSFVVAGLGFFWASWNPEKQSWHDMIAGTVIVRTPRSMPLV